MRGRWFSRINSGNKNGCLPSSRAPQAPTFPVQCWSRHAGVMPCCRGSARLHPPQRPLQRPEQLQLPLHPPQHPEQLQLYLHPPQYPEQLQLRLHPPHPQRHEQLQLPLHRCRLGGSSPPWVCQQLQACRRKCLIRLVAQELLGVEAQELLGVEARSVRHGWLLWGSRCLRQLPL